MADNIKHKHHGKIIKLKKTTREKGAFTEPCLTPSLPPNVH